MAPFVFQDEGNGEGDEDNVDSLQCAKKASAANALNDRDHADGVH